MRILFPTLLAFGLVVMGQEPWLPPTAPEAPAPEVSEPQGTLFLEGGASLGDGVPQRSWYLGLDGRSTWRWSPTLGATLNARVDRDWMSRPGGASTTLTLREAFLAWRPKEGWALDLGRMQVREGVALGFNPTDGFRRDALLAWRTQDFNRLRESRLGVVGLRLQVVREGRSLALVLAPRIRENEADPRGYDPRFGRTNAAARWSLRVSPGSLGPLYGSVVVAGGEGGRSLAGLNLSAGLGRATVAYLEAAQVKRPPEEGGPEGRFHQWAGGATYTTPWRQSLSLEVRRNGAQPRRLSESTLPLEAWSQALRWQEPASRDSLLLHGTWDRLLSDFLTLQALWQRDLREATSMAWGELAYRRTRASLGLALLRQTGAPLTAFGLTGQRWAATLTFRWYL